VSTPEASEESDRIRDRWSVAFREAAIFVFSLLAAWVLINHRVLFVFPPDLSLAEGATWQTYLFLAVLADLALHVAVLLLWPSPSTGSRVTRLGPEDLGAGVVRNEASRRPARVALAESQPRGVESALSLRRAFTAAERSWSDTVAQEYIDDLASLLDADNEPVNLPEPALPDNGSLRPVRVVRRVIRGARPEPQSFQTSGPSDVPAEGRTRPGERNSPGP